MYHSVLLAALCCLAATASASHSSSTSSKTSSKSSSKSSSFKTSTTKTSSTSSSASPTASVICDNYDDLSAGLLPVTGLSPAVGTYNGLQYIGWNVGGPDLINTNDSHGGVVPRTAPNEALGQAPKNGISLAVTVAYSGSPYSTFDLTSFYFACNADLNEGEVDVAQACVIAAYGVYPDGSQTGVATFGSFDDDSTAQTMVLAVLPSSFEGVTTVFFGVASSATTPDVTNILIDNLCHRNRA